MGVSSFLHLLRNVVVASGRGYHWGVCCEHDASFFSQTVWVDNVGDAAFGDNLLLRGLHGDGDDVVVAAHF